MYTYFLPKKRWFSIAMLGNTGGYILKLLTMDHGYCFLKSTSLKTGLLWDDHPSILQKNEQLLVQTLGPMACSDIGVIPNI